MRELTARGLPYAEWVEARGEALKARMRARKLAQGRVRDKYGFKRPRKWGLVRRDVRAAYVAWANR